MLYIVATPIGNLDDTSARALRVLRESDVIACEDTRRTRALLSHFDISGHGRLLSYREHNERPAGERIIRMLQEGKTVALCSDGGYPGVSDPGYRLIVSAVEQELDFEIVPGASAVTVGLLYSGLPCSSYTFKGYPPRKSGSLRRFFEEEKESRHTLIVFESPMRIARTLQAALESLGDRRASVCIELTKKFERISRGYLSELCEEFSGRKVRGEITLVIAGHHPKFARE